MTIHRSLSVTTLAGVLALFGCDQKGEVNREIEELKQAQQESPEKAQELNKELQQAKSNVVRLEEKVALAKQGVTDEVMKEQEEVKQALGKQEQEVKEETAEAQGKAREHNEGVTNAQQQLEKVQSAQRVRAQVTTQTQVVPSETKVEVEKQQQAPMEQNKLVERKTEQTGTATTTRSTLTGADKSAGTATAE